MFCARKEAGEATGDRNGVGTEPSASGGDKVAGVMVLSVGSATEAGMGAGSAKSAEEERTGPVMGDKGIDIVLRLLAVRAASAGVLPLQAPLQHTYDSASKCKTSK